ncbi:MAG: transcriptional repressor, partial [Rhodococcus sp. (in: high G+C Gram-positive bacteria)]
MPLDNVTKDPVAQLRSVGLRVTGPRVAVLNAVAARPHSDADDVAAVVRAEAGSVSMQAVYDVLRACVNAGLLRRIEPAGSPALYETRTGDNHHHLVCRGC